MFFSTVFILASLSALPALAAPIPRHLKIRAAANTTASGWPASADSSARSSFGISGDYKDSYIQTVDGAPTLVGNYPKGSYAGSTDPGIGGFIFEATGGVDLSNAKEALLNYEVQFPEGFDFVLAGKIPGLYGGENSTIAKTCAGGHHNDACWSARLMWRTGGAGELYAYLPTANQKLAICEDKCDVQYGASIDRGAWTFQPGEWTQLSERVKLNDVGEMNAEIEISVGGKSVILVQGLQLRGTSAGRITGIMVHTFFGGSSSPDYQTPKNQTANFRNFTLAVTESL